MNVKSIALLILFLPFIGISQEYIDLLKIGYSHTFDAKFEGTDNSTEIKGFEAGITLPVVLNEKYALISGATFSTNNLQLFPLAPNTDLYSTMLKLGLATSHNEKWSSTIVFLPKMASDYKNLSGDDFYFGGYAVVKQKKSENLTIRYGLYGSTEAFGPFATPMIGVYYKSPNKRLEIDASLPIVADVNYTFGKATIGFDYFGIGRSFNISQDEFSEYYIEQSPLEFSGYFQLNTLQKSVLLRAKVGYTSNIYEVYEQGDKLDFRVSAFSFGDNRTQLNPDIKGSVFIKFEAIYRLQFDNAQSDSKK